MNLWNLWPFKWVMVIHLMASTVKLPEWLWVTQFCPYNPLSLNLKNSMDLIHTYMIGTYVNIFFVEYDLLLLLQFDEIISEKWKCFILSWSHLLFRPEHSFFIVPNEVKFLVIIKRLDRFCDNWDAIQVSAPGL